MQSFWILLSTFFTALSYALIKALPEAHTFYEIFFVRSLSLLLVVGLLAASTRTAVTTAHPVLHLRRVAAGVTSLCINIVVVQHLPLGTAQTLIFTTPLFVTAWAIGMAVLKKTSVNLRLASSVLVGFAGVALVMQPTAGGSLFYAGLALTSGLLCAVVNLTLRELGQLGEPVIRSVFYFALGGMVFSLILMLLFSQCTVWSLFTEPLLLAVGLTTVGSQLAQAQGWGKGKTLLCANLQFSAILFAAVFGQLFFDEVLDGVTWAGIALLIAAEIRAVRLQFPSRK